MQWYRWRTACRRAAPPRPAALPRHIRSADAITRAHADAVGQPIRQVGAAVVGTDPARRGPCYALANRDGRDHPGQRELLDDREIEVRRVHEAAACLEGGSARQSEGRRYVAVAVGRDELRRVRV